MSTIAQIQWTIKSTPNLSSSASSSQNSKCTVYVGAEPQQSHQAGQVISCLTNKNIKVQNSDPSSATHFFLLITDSFLKSKAQLLPLVLRLTDPHFKQRLFPVIMEPTLSIYKPGAERRWVDYWERILSNTNPQSSQYREIKAIQENIGVIIRVIRDTLLPRLDELLQDDLVFVTNTIEKRGHLLQEKRFFFLPAVQTDSTIGLKAPLAQLSSLFENKSTVILTGEKGTGKTTLAIEYAKGSTIYPTGILWFNMEHLENAYETLAVQLGTSKEDAKRELLRMEKALLIFDNVLDRSTVPSFPTCHTLIIGSNIPQSDMTMTGFTLELNDPEAAPLATILHNNPAKIAAAMTYIKSRKISVENYIHFYLNDRDNLLAKQQSDRPVTTLISARRNSIGSVVDSSVSNYQNQSVQELSQELKNQEIQIFVSYNWGAKSEVEQIDSAFKAMGIEILRDTREARPFESLQEFMKKVIRQADYTFSIVTDSYLKSFNCIFEVINLLQDPYWKSRIFPIVLAEAPLDEQVYVTHWQQEAARLKQVGSASEVAIAEEGARKIGPFLQFVKGQQPESFKKHLNTNFQTTLATMLARQEKLEKKGLYRQGIFHLPAGQNKNFTGREREMKLLEDSLKKGQHSAITNTGMGGVGKSQLAIEYAYRHEQDYELIYWIRSEDVSTLKADYRQLGQEMGIGEDFLKDDKVITTVKGELEKRKNWLLIFDNAESSKTLAEAMPQRGGHALITSRNPNWTRTIAIDTFNNDEAIHYLKKISGVVEQDFELSLLAKDLGYLPLALSQAGAYIKRQQIDVATYRAEYKKLLSEHEKGYPGSVATAWLMSIDKITKEDPNALQLLYICSYLAPDNIPDTLLSAWLNKKTNRNTGLDFQEALRVLESYSLISQRVVKKEGEHKKFISIHRLIQTVTQDKCPQEEAMGAIGLCIEVLNEQFNGHISTKEEHEAAVAIIEHAKAVAAHAEEKKLLDLSLGGLTSAIGAFLQSDDNLNGAKEMLEKALAIFIADLGTEDTLVALSYHHLGRVLRDLGDLKGARELYEKALAIFIATLGTENHIDVAACYNSLGTVLSDLGDLKGARELHEKALAIYIATLGTENHLNVAHSYNSLGIVLSDLGDLKGARELHEKALAIYIATLGTENHLNVAHSYNSLGAVFSAQGDLKEAKEMFEKALAIKIAIFGTENHLIVADSYNNLGTQLSAQGDKKGAKEIFEKALAIYINILGTENHLSIAQSYNNLGAVLSAQGDLKRAREMFEKAMAIKIAIFGTENHNDIAQGYGNLGNVLSELGDLKGARELHEKALAIFIATLGTENHLSVAICYNNLGIVLKAQGDLKEAKRMYEKALAIKIATLGTEIHTDVADSYYSLGAVLKAQGDLKGAKEMYEKALASYIAALSTENHLSVAKSYFNLGGVLKAQGDLKGAKAIYEKALVSYITALSTENHLSVANSYYNLGGVLKAQGDLKGAKEIYGKALVTYIAALSTEIHTDVADSYNQLGVVLENQGDLNEAKEMYEKALVTYIAALGTEIHTDVADSYKSLGDVCYSLNQQKEAGECYVKARDIYLHTAGEYDKIIDARILECSQSTQSVRRRSHTVE